MRRIVTISYTGLNAGGGVPKFNRDLHAAFPDRKTVHFCWEDFPWWMEVDDRGASEWEKARTLNEYLVRTRTITSDDVVIADGFWAFGLEHLPYAVSHSHGIWSHLTADDVRANKQPDMPYHHAAQVAFRTRWSELNKPMTAVSRFISEQMMLQWGFRSKVINNGVDTDLYRPMEKSDGYGLKRPFIIHGVNDMTNVNKGWDHIELLVKELPNATIMSLDEAERTWAFRSDKPWTKPMIMAQADLVVHPSGYEGNSMFVAEALSCGVPVVGYNVGFLAHVGSGSVLDRNLRSPEYFATGVKTLVNGLDDVRATLGQLARDVAVRNLSLDRFYSNWDAYVSELEGDNNA